MKSKELAARLNAAYAEKDVDALLAELENVINDLLKEGHEMMRTRNARSDRAVLAIVAEQENKYRAAVRKANLPASALPIFQHAVWQVTPNVYAGMVAHHNWEPYNGE